MALYRPGRPIKCAEGDSSFFQRTYYGGAFPSSFPGFPRSVFIVDWLLTFIFIGSIRVVIRLLLSASENIQFEDLLGREPVNLDMKRIGEYLADKTVLVSGAGGIKAKLKEIMPEYTPFALQNEDKYIYGFEK